MATKRTKPRSRTSASRSRHAVAARLHQDIRLTLEGAALDVIIRSGGRKLGVVGIGRGSITWRGHSDKTALPLDWEQFIALMEGERRTRTVRRPGRTETQA